MILTRTGTHERQTGFGHLVGEPSAALVRRGDVDEVVADDEVHDGPRHLTRLALEAIGVADLTSCDVEYSRFDSLVGVVQRPIQPSLHQLAYQLLCLFEDELVVLAALLHARSTCIREALGALVVRTGDYGAGYGH